MTGLVVVMVFPEEPQAHTDPEREGEKCQDLPPGWALLAPPHWLVVRHSIVGLVSILLRHTRSFLAQGLFPVSPELAVPARRPSPPGK